MRQPYVTECITYMHTFLNSSFKELKTLACSVDHCAHTPPQTHTISLTCVQISTQWWIPGCFQFRDPNKWPTLIETNRAAMQETGGKWVWENNKSYILYIILQGLTKRTAWWTRASVKDARDSWQNCQGPDWPVLRHHESLTSAQVLPV